jgi:hypothetical protein
MKTTRRFQTALTILISICVFSLRWTMSSGRKLILDPTAKHPDANGTAVLADDHINLQARGLKPEAVYTVWFVNMKPKKTEIGAGPAPFMFRTGPWGNGSYSAPLNEEPFGKWSMVMI